MNKSKEIEGLAVNFVNEKAPRTGVGVAKNGSLLLLQVLVLCDTSYLILCDTV